MGFTYHPDAKNPPSPLIAMMSNTKGHESIKTPFQGLIPPMTATIANSMPSQLVIANQLLPQSRLVIHYDQ